MVASTLLCVYCGSEKALEDMTDEHVLPRALGGALEPINPFKIQVCRPCNNRCGQFVDGPFSRSYSIHLARLSAARSAAAITADAILPLGYMGHIKAWQGQGICDFWIGPTGDSIYHFHDAYQGDEAIVGKPLGPGRKTADPGVVFVGILATNPVWHPIVVRSVKAEFPEARIHYINASHQGVGPPYPPVPDGLRQMFEWAKSLNGLNTECALSLDPYCGDRFTAKLGLGIGSLVLGQAFDRSENATELRRFMWTREPNKRKEVDVHGSAFSLFAKNQDLEVLLAWRGCHTIALIPTGDRLVLGVNLYAQHGMAVMLSHDTDLWKDRVSELGKVWVVCPGLRRCVGPMSFFDFYVNSRTENPSGVLRELGELLDAAPYWPPKHIESDLLHAQGSGET